MEEEISTTYIKTAEEKIKYMLEEQKQKRILQLVIDKKNYQEKIKKIELEIVETANIQIEDFDKIKKLENLL